MAQLHDETAPSILSHCQSWKQLLRETITLGCPLGLWTPARLVSTLIQSPRLSLSPPSYSIHLWRWSQFLARFGANPPRILLSPRAGFFFLSRHSPFPPFTFHHISWNPFMCLYIYSNSTTPFKRQTKPLMPSTHTSLLFLVSSATLPLCSCS